MKQWEKINKEISRQKRILDDMIQAYPMNTEYNYDIAKQQGIVQGLELAGYCHDD